MASVEVSVSVEVSEWEESLLLDILIQEAQAVHQEEWARPIPKHSPEPLPLWLAL